MTTRESLHEMLDELPESLLHFAEESLRQLKGVEDDPFWQALETAPLDDEPTTAEDIAAIERGRASMRDGRGMPQAEVERLLNL